MRQIKKGYDFLAITFFSQIITNLTAKIGASSADLFLFIFINHFIGFSLAYFFHYRKRKSMGKISKKNSIKFGVVTGLVSFFAYLFLLNSLVSGTASLIFPLVNMNVFGVALLSMIIFKEKINIKGILGIILAFAAIWLLK